MPASGANASKTTVCAAARLAPPSTLPSTMLHRGTGATSTACRKPSRRSSMSVIVAKIAVNSTTISNIPGKKYAM